jgi:hypothetical protein
MATTQRRVQAKSKQSLIPPKYDKAKPLALAGLVGLIISYLLGSRALDTGSYWEYLFTVIFLVITVRLFIRSITKM